MLLRASALKEAGASKLSVNNSVCATTMTHGGANKAQHDGYGGSLAGKIGRGAFARTNRAAIRGFVCRGARALRFTSTRGAVSRFARIAAEGSVDRDDGARAGAGDEGASTPARQG